MLKQIVLAALLMCASGATLAQEASQPQLKIGTEWIMRHGDPTKDSSHLFRYTIARTEQFDGRTYIVITRDDIEAWLAADTLSLGRVMHADNEVESYQPDWADWRWPMFVGKTWSSDYRHKTGAVFEEPAHAQWTVAAYEDVTVPAGTFKAFRIERIPGANTIYVATRWYAPSVGLMIKQIESQTDRRGEIVEELVSYTGP